MGQQTSINVQPVKGGSEELAKAKTGRTMQAKATPIREGVVVIQKSTTMEDLHRLADAYRDRLGVEVFQIAIHRDEGYKGSKDWKPNLHAHLVFDWTDHSNTRQRPKPSEPSS